MSLVPCVTVRSTLVGATGIFCPTCGGDRPAEIRTGRRWVRVGRVPLLPLGRGPGHVACMTCSTRYGLEAVDQLTTGTLAERLDAAAHHLTVMVVRAGDRANRDLRRQAVHQIRRVAPAYDQNQLDRDLAVIDPASAAEQVAGLRGALEIEGKERIVADLVHLALAAHTITSHQRWVIETVGTTLGLTPLHLTGIVTGIAAAVEPPADRP